ncbi:MAG: hypothetical protein ABR524_11580, partial [Thermoanaerobaculia bacterium]
IEEMDEELADLLEAAGYDDLDSILNASVEDLIAIEGVDEEMAMRAIELATQHEMAEVESAVVEDEDDEEYEEEDEDEDGDDDESTVEEDATEPQPVATEDVDRS